MDDRNTILCRCEDLTRERILACIEEGYQTIDEIKRVTRAGMGPCQGGFSGPRVQDILARELGCSPLDIPMDSEGSWVLCGETKTQPAEQ